MGCRLEVHVEVLRQVPAQGEVAVPQELLREGQRQVGVLCILQVTFLQLVVAARQFGVERDALRQVVQSQGLGEVHPLGLRLDILERLPRLIDGRVGIIQ